MEEAYKYDEAAALAETVSTIHNDWQELYAELPKGEKGYLTQIKNRHLRIIAADPQAAAESLAMYERNNFIIGKFGIDKFERALKIVENDKN